MMLDLPGDLIEEILCHVPATSLKRLRSTCKPWNSLFNDSRFARNHLDKAAKQFLVLRLTKLGATLTSVKLLIRSRHIVVNDDLPLNNSAQTKIDQVSFCDGLLLCTIKDQTRILVWNPCIGQTKWITPSDGFNHRDTYVLGSYKDNKSGKNSYKILRISCHYHDQEFEICEINSNSWRILVVPPCGKLYDRGGVYLKGKSYWFASDIEEKHMFLVSFDYTRERFERMDLDQCQIPSVGCETVALSVVREEKLSVLVQRSQTFKREIWVTNKIDVKTKVVSWNKVFTVDLSQYPFRSIVSSFLVDEEKKILVCCERWTDYKDMLNKEAVYIFGEDSEVTLVHFGKVGYGPRLFNYVPSLIQIR